ncbi:MAG: T9SS type A sorting domain-containing protein [Taibaiella sp.]|nr:T9SS type A sorting domain-containing protein [Taibaiella sp.]
MKKLFTPFITCMVLTATVYGQAHVFTKANGPVNPTGIDTIYGTVLTSVPAVPDGQWHTWDLSQVIIASYRYYAQFSTASGFANATHSNRAYVENQGMSYVTNFMFSIDNSGIKTHGERLARQAFPLGAQTMNPNDSLVIKAQDVVYSAPQVQMPYPATMGTKWNATSKAVFNMEVTVSPLYNKAAAERRSIINSTCEVIGWGRLSIKRLDGKPSGTRHVLLVKSTVSTQDSFYLNGTAAPAPLLQMAGLQQGQTQVVYQKSFYREYEMMPMANITYEDATFADNKKKDVNFHCQRLPYPDGVEDVAGGLIAEIYPNPSNGIFTVYIPESGNSKWSYTITDVTGKLVTKGQLNSNKTLVSMQGTVAPGSYIATIYQDGTAVSGQKLVIQ